MRNTFGFAQIAQKNCVKLFSFHAQKFEKNISSFAQFAQKSAQNRAKLIAFHAQKLRKSSQKNVRENSANFAQKKAISWKP